MAAAAPRRTRLRLVRLGVALCVATIAAVAGTMAYENWSRHRLNRNESAVIAALRNIWSAQAQCQASGAIDRNGNGQGEYGYLHELAGGARRDGGQRLAPPVLSSGYAQLVDGRVERSGYLLQMFLPDEALLGVSEADAQRGVSVSAQESERYWCCYAWPVDPGGTGNRTFFTSHCGCVLATYPAAYRYGGVERPCTWSAAFAATSEQRTFAADSAANTIGFDGNRWVVI